jgi:hypothetical protein
VARGVLRALGKETTMRARPLALALALALLAAVAADATSAHAQQAAGLRPAAAGKDKYQSAIDRKVRQMKSWVWDQATASYTEVVFRPGLKAKLLRSDDYQPERGINQSKLIKVTGAKGGVVQLTVINNVSAHDLYREGMAETDFRTAVQNRIQGDRVRVSVKYANGTTQVVKDGVLSRDVTAIPIEVTLQKGVNEIRVDRTDAQGRVMGAADMLGGRRVEVQWDGGE